MFSKLRNFISLDQPGEYEYEYEEADHRQHRQAMDNGAEMPKTVAPMAEIVIVEPSELEEMPQVIQLLWKRKSVLLNLKKMNPEQAQRALDFVAGGTYAIEGDQQLVGEMIFLFTLK